MKLIGLKEAKTTLSACVAESQHERVLITRRGRPAALVIGVEGQDLEEMLLAGDAEFWKTIEGRRRRHATLTSDDIRRSFGITTAAEPKATSRRQPRGCRPTGGRNRR
jgi:prevent-host-death family protein